jgi:hypothetical protein
MKSKLSRIYFLITFVAFSSIAFTQTVINYQTWTGASGCNIFSSLINVPATINGTSSSVAHLTAIGQPTYDNVNKSVNLVSEIVSGSQNNGTEYRTSVNFLAGYSYKITINAARIMSTQTGPNVLLRLDLNNGGSGNNTLCNGTGVIDASGSGNLKQSFQIISSSFSDYIFNYSSLSVAQAYLMMAAIPPAGSVFQTILIRKITIEESAPPPSFSVAPSPTAVTCGATTPVTFTATGSNIPNGATVTYSWNLGSNNGWLYSGSAAPSTISTGTTNTLALTSVCGSALNNISVTATVNGTAYNSNSIGVTNTQPSLYINGNSAFCSGTGSYNIPGLPCNATVSWSSSNSNIATITPTGNPVTLTKTGDGSVTITATISGVACLINNILTKSVAVGNPQASNITLWNSKSTTTIGSPVAFVAGYPPANRCQILSTDWQIFTMGASINTGSVPCEPDNGTSKYIFFQSTGTAYVQARVQNSCGWSNWSAAVPIQVTSGFLISPNPATDVITIQEKQSSTAKDGITAVKIFDNAGNLKKQMKCTSGAKQVKINVADLKPGMYYVEISSGQINERLQLVIQK